MPNDVDQLESDKADLENRVKALEAQARRTEDGYQAMAAMAEKHRIEAVQQQVEVARLRAEAKAMRDILENASKWFDVGDGDEPPEWVREARSILRARGGNDVK